MYEKLIKQLRETSIDFGESDHISVMMIEAANAIEDLITALTASNEVIAKNKTKWIPVTERLPEIDMSYPHHEDYLVQYDSGNVDVASWSNVNWFWTDHVTEPHWNCVQFAKVIAWMPLPQPPEDGES